MAISHLSSNISEAKVQVEELNKSMSIVDKREKSQKFYNWRQLKIVVILIEGFNNLIMFTHLFFLSRLQLKTWTNFDLIFGNFLVRTIIESQKAYIVYAKNQSNTAKK